MYKSTHLLQKVLLCTLAAVIPWQAVLAKKSTTTTTTTSYSAEDFSSTPSILSQNVAPMVLFGMSNDHQLFYKAYTDYDDLNNDGTVDTTYLHSFQYYGYFDSTKCYDYESGQFEPKALADSDNYCTGSNSSYWSGNYLNWATMARIDTVRKLLYGGYRSTDKDDETVLERTYLPNDAHSFAKFYDGDDLNKLTPFSGSDVTNGITICNTTVKSSGYSQNITADPLIRVAKGDFSLWAANERWQCRWSKGSNANVPADSGLDAASDHPNKSNDGLGEKNYIARIEVCVDSLIGSENCKQYPDGNYKPIGLVQKYGDDELVHFGLMTGSYTKNKSGGVLRKNIGSISDEINTTTDGTFKTAPAAGSIITTLNSFRLYGYNHQEGYYNDSSPGDNCKWAKSSFNNGDCSNWGNPVAEILSECYRYYGGKNAAFDTDDSGRISGLKTASWEDPLSSDNACAKLNVIMLNASSISYDADELSSFDNNFGADTETLTNQIGDAEGITGNEYFVGNNSSDENELCTSKTVSNLGEVQGTCPDAPRLEGSYKMAGAAYFAKTNDIRSLSGEQNVTTYGVALSPAVPSITIPVPGSTTKEVSILPACRNTDNNTNCAIVDFKISKAYQEDPENLGTFIGTLYVNWEDSEQGGDYDQDMWGTIKYSITSSQITITTDVLAQSTPDKMGFGYVISGTNNDGFHVHSGINGTTVSDCNNCTTNNSASSKSYTLGSSSAELLESPLFYAAKWGGFTDSDDDKKPSTSSEWDTKDNSTGDTIVGGDGIPDNYFLATNPSQLESQLKEVLDSIIATTASGTGATVVSNSTSGMGAIYQALYQPQTTEGNDTVEWIGSLNGIFIDDKANLREDADGDGVLDGYDTDKIIKISYDDNLGDTYFQRYSTSDSGTTLVADGGLESLHDLLPVWSAVDQLASFSNSEVRSQRSYSSNANNGRYIFTAVEQTSDGIVNNHNVVDFTATAMASNYGFMAIDSSETTNLVNYIRGDDSIANSRNRTLDGKVWRLGDIIHSSPVMVSYPDAGYDDSHGDTSYGEFLAQYSNRRQVVYVGANDGMLHAFNGGFWDETNQQFKLTNTSEKQHPLGSELWAYIPTNLLPHLQWLKDSSYPHVYYMDGEGFAQDVKIFSDDATHKNGWGTILVMGMRFGGGAMELDTNGNGNADTTTGSGYVIMDITDPESKPVLLAEITAPEFGFTTSKPAIAKKLDDSTNEWTLVFGSGPHGDSALTNGHSDQKARIVQIDLNTVYNNYKNNAADSIYINKFSPSDDIDEKNSLVGDITVTDWDLDLIDDVVYFGTSSLESSGDAEGKLMRFSLSTGNVKTLTDPERPIMSAPLTAIDTTVDSNRWVMAGTGRYITSADLSDQRQHWFFGVKEPQKNNGTYEYKDNVEFDDEDDGLVDTTDVRVYSDGSLLENGSAYTLGGDTISNFEEMRSGTVDEPTAGMIGQAGWKVKFEKPSSAPSGRSVGPGVADPVNTGVFAFTEYVPPSQVCEVNGESYIWSLSYETGTSTYYAPLGEDSTTTNTTESGTVTASLNKISAGDETATGMVSGLTYHTGTDGLKLIVSDSTGGISAIEVNTEVINGGQGRQSWRQIDTSQF